MHDRIALETPRLHLRAWHDADLDPLAQICADPQVMRYLQGPQSRDECAALIARCRMHFADHGYGFWALERKDDGRFIGMLGLSWCQLPLPFCPAVEINWRLAQDQWGQGLAHEAAEAVLACAFDRLQLPEVVAFTAKLNAASQRLAEGLGMQHDPRDDFEHPDLPADHPLRPHRLYRLKRPNLDQTRR